MQDLIECTYDVDMSQSMEQIKSVEESFWKSQSDMLCLSFSKLASQKFYLGIFWTHCLI